MQPPNHLSHDRVALMENGEVEGHILQKQNITDADGTRTHSLCHRKATRYHYATAPNMKINDAYFSTFGEDQSTQLDVRRESIHPLPRPKLLVIVEMMKVEGTTAIQ